MPAGAVSLTSRKVGQVQSGPNFCRQEVLFCRQPYREENLEHLSLSIRNLEFYLVQQPKTNESVYRSASTSQVQIGQRTGLYQQNSDHSLGPYGGPMNRMTLF